MSPIIMSAFENVHRSRKRPSFSAKSRLLFRGCIAAPPESRAVSKEIRIWHVIYCLGCRRGPELRAVSKEIRDLARNLLPRMPDGESRTTCCFERNQDLARNFTARMPTGAQNYVLFRKKPGYGYVIYCRGCRMGSPELRAVLKEIRIWHVIYCRGCRRNVPEYMHFTQNIKNLALFTRARMGSEQ